MSTLESALDGELEIEREKEYWYPLWPSESGTHPWE
ncbi:PspA-associated protein PspAB [Natrinema thermotolerans]